MPVYYIIIGLVAFCAGAAIAYCVKTKSISKKIEASEIEAHRLLKDAKQRSGMILKEAEFEAKDKLFRSKSEFDAESQEARAELRKRDKRLIEKEERLDHKAGQLESKDREFVRKEKLLKKREININNDERKYNELIDEQKKQLEKISALTAEQAKELLIRAMENEAKYEGARLIKRIENEAQKEADKKAKKIISTAIQRYAGDYVAERTVSVIQLLASAKRKL